MRTGPRAPALWAAPIVVALVFGLVGCYTMLKHPITENEGPERTDADVHSQEYYRQNCLDCHADYATYPYGYFYGFYPEYYFENPRWGYYYAYPWWWDHQWYEPDAAEAGGDEGTSSTKAERRGGIVPPYVDRAPAVSAPGGTGGGYRAIGSGVGTGKGGTGTEPGGAGPGTTPTKTRVKITGQTPPDSTGTTEQKTTDKKADRRGGVPPN
ncbi:MAG: hypothetical protein AB1792_00065 [Candidatus Zixiibacteriota bacterium]